MKVFAISDLHLSLEEDSQNLYKPMSVFGQHWENHHLKIAENWCRHVGENDLVLIPGDHSWAINLVQAKPDLEFIGALPGHKLLIKGNHDYWWESISKVRKNIPNKVYALQNDAWQFGEVGVCGTRGWITPYDEGFDPQDDAKIYEREALRLEMSLKMLQKLQTSIKIALLHYPPSIGNKESLFTNLLEQYQVDYCVYGHVHSEYHHYIDGFRQTVDYHLVSCDYLDFNPKLITEL